MELYCGHFHSASSNQAWKGGLGLLLAIMKKHKIGEISGCIVYFMASEIICHTVTKLAFWKASSYSVTTKP